VIEEEFYSIKVAPPKKQEPKIEPPEDLSHYELAEKFEKLR
jgi:hypothetical protein